MRKFLQFKDYFQRLDYEMFLFIINVFRKILIINYGGLKMEIFIQFLHVSVLRVNFKWEIKFLEICDGLEKHFCLCQCWAI